MARIVVRAKKRVRVETESDSLTIGTRTTADLTLRDPVAAELHARVSASSEGFTVEDLGTTTGTYRNGLRVEGRESLAEGDELVLGVTKLVVHLEQEGGAAVLALDLFEDAFFQRAKLAGGATPGWVSGDREALKEAEIEFGAFPALRVAGWSAVGVVILLAVALLVPKLRGPLLQPGPLHNLHADVIAADQCDVCHQSRGDHGTAGCRTCHQETLAGRHPFPSTVGFAVAEAACHRCHLEHQGTETVARATSSSGGVPVTVRDPAFVPPDFADVVACEECHRAGVPDEEAARARIARLGGEPDGATGAAGRAPERLDAFSHAAHVGRASIACDRCHEPSEVPGRDFAPVAFTTCMTCHHHESNRAYTAAEVEPDATWLAAAPDFRIDVHGVPREGAGGGEGARCDLCHQPGDTTRRLVVPVERPRFVAASTGEALPFGEGHPRRYFELETRGHEGLAASVDCSECHAAGTLAGEPRSERAFFHPLHTTDELVGEHDDERAAELSRTCFECHRGVAAARTLDAPVFDEASCQACHAAGTNGTPREMAPASTESERRHEFPHDLHTASSRGPLARGCLACHEFQSASDPLSAAPFTPPRIADCSACHTAAHEYTDFGCSVCHVDTSATQPAPPPAPRGFSHFGTGHAELLSDCSRCHEGAASAERVPQVGMPRLSDPDCFTCHFERRFHWR